MTTPQQSDVGLGVFNCRLDTASDTRLVRAVGLSYGLDIVSKEDQGRLNRTFYPAYTDSNMFAVSIVLINYVEKDNLEQWLKTYMLGVLNGKESVMRVRIDAREFDRLGVFTQGIEFGDAVGKYDYSMTLTFQGARDAITVKSPGLSRFEGGTAADYTDFGQYFYPAGRQLAGHEQAPQFYDDIPLGNTKITLPDGKVDPVADLAGKNNSSSPLVGVYADPTNPPSQPTGTTGTKGRVGGNLP